MGKEGSWIQYFGQKWDATLATLWNDVTVSVRQIGRRLGVDSLTVKRHAAKQGLAFPRLGKRVTGKNGPPTVGQCRPPQRSRLGAKQKQWLDTRSLHPLDSKTMLRNRIPACYAFLYRHSRDWLNQNSPKRLASLNIHKRVNWNARDSELAEMVPKARDLLLLEPGRPKRISISALGRQLKALALIQKHQIKLPRAVSALESAEESRVAFACRRVCLACARLQREGRRLCLSAITREAGLRPDLATNPEVVAAITAACGKQR